ncbi:MAG: RNase P subunit p30 family protein [Candidatus Heimdallarchaeaceae archaeon]
MGKHLKELINNKLSCENFVPFVNKENLDHFVQFARKLNFSMLVIDELNRETRDKYLRSVNTEKNHFLLSPMEIYDKISKKSFSEERLLSLFKQELVSESMKRSLMLVSRTTLQPEKLNDLKNNLSKIRRDYELISVKSSEKGILNWAAHDRRIDYLTFFLNDEKVSLDSSICSLVKQHKKYIEIVLLPLLTARNDKELSTYIRNGKKIVNLLITLKVPFVLTIHPESPYNLRNSLQLRYLGELISAPFNKTNASVFTNQLSSLLHNVMKLHKSYLLEGVKGV